MRTQNIISLVAAGTLCLGASVGSALAQGTAKSDHFVWGESYSGGGWDVRTAASGNCPAMNVHVVRYRDGLQGILSTGEWAGMSRLTGDVDQSGKFTLAAKPIEPNGPTGTIEGTVDQVRQFLDVKLKGFGCSDRSLRIPYSMPDPKID